MKYSKRHSISYKTESVLHNGKPALLRMPCIGRELLSENTFSEKGTSISITFCRTLDRIIVGFFSKHFFYLDDNAMGLCFGVLYLHFSMFY